MPVVPEWGLIGLVRGRAAAASAAASRVRTTGGADGDDPRGTSASGAINGFGGLGRNGIALAVEMDFADAVDAERSECAEADVERDASDLDAFGSEGCEHLRREVQAGGGRGYGAALVGEDGLIAVAIGVGVVAMDVGRQWDVADAVEHGEEVVDWRRTRAVARRTGRARGLRLRARWRHRRRGKDEALADGDLAAGTDEGAPAVVAGRFDEA